MDTPAPAWAARIAVASALARHPRRTAAILWAQITGRRLRARQGRAALVGIDHRLTLPPEILHRFPVESAPAEDQDPCVLIADGHGLVAGARAMFAAAFAADPALHALYGDALIQAKTGGPVLPLLRSAFDPDLSMAVDAIGPVIALRRASLSEAGIGAAVTALEATFRIAERYGAATIGHLPAVVSVGRPGGEAGILTRPNLTSDEARVLSPVRERDRVRDATFPERPDPSPQPSPARERGPGGNRRSTPGAVAGSENRQGEGERLSPQARLEIVRRHLDRTGHADAGLVLDSDGIITVERPLPDLLPAVSLIVPTRDRLDLLRPCLASLRARTDWPDVEILICDNDSREPETLAYFRALEGEGAARIVACPGPFDFAAMNNAAAAQARGSLLAFVNNDVAAFEPGWLRRMAREALRPEIGAVGAKLLDGEGRVQHGGIVLGTGGLVTHAHRHFPGDAPGYGFRLRATHTVSAVTAACLVVEAAKFRGVGGFDARNFAVDFNDVDLCLRLTEAGYRTLMVPGAVLHHREGASRRRTPEAQARHEREIAALKTRWGPLLAQDPHYHPGFDPDLSTHARLRAGGPNGPTGPVAVRRSGPSRSPT